MADKLIFPIGFDLESAVKQAEGDADKLLRRLSVAIQSKPLAVNLKINGAGDGSINSINQRIKELVDKWNSLTEAERIASRTSGEYTSEAKRILKEYTKLVGASESYARSLQQINAAAKRSANEQERNVAKQRAAWTKLRNVISANENTIDGLNAKIKAYQQRLNGLEVGSKKFEKTAAKIRDLSLKLDEAKRKTAELTGSVDKTSNAFSRQDGYVSRLVKRLAVYAGYQQIANFLKGVKEVTAQFELQRVSLGAILQSQTKANALFSEIKQFALKSPVSILDLTKYTKQLAAYKIGYDELFETTKRLTDISTGLSIPLERIILFYGQVRAKGWLTAQDLKQATEAGIPLTEELAKKLSAINGELVTAGQVMDMISKRQISFEQVKEVFDDMTSAGGMFYNMQEKQGNTLFGLWAKLGDAASVMYDEIGNTDSVNEGMKSAIEGLTELMRNWRSWAKTAATMGGLFSVTTAAVAIYTTVLKANTIAKKANTTESIAARTENIKGNVVLRLTNSLLQECGVSANKATAYTIAFSKAFRLIGAISFGAVIAGVTWIVEKCFEAYENAHRLGNALKEIETESGIEQMKSVRNFEALATVAVEAADGSKKQKDALEELLRTYKDIIPQERLTIENLRAMKGNYDSLTDSIRTYVAEQMKQKQINTVLEITGKKMIESTRDIQDIMKGTWSYEQIARFMSAYEQIIRNNPGISAAEAMKKAAEDTGVGWQKMLSLGAITRDQLTAALRSFASSLKEQITQVDALDAAWNNNYMALGKYGKSYENLVNKVRENPIEMGGNAEFDESKTPYFYKQQQQNLEILKVMIPTLKQIMSDANVVWQDGWVNIVSTIDTAQPQIISSIDFDAINKFLQDNIGVLTDEQRTAISKLQEMYLNIGIPSEVVQHNRKLAIDLANSMSDSLSKIGDGSRTAIDNVTKYLMVSGQSVNDYAKTLDDALNDLKARIAELSAVGLLLSPEGRKELEDLQTTAEFVERLRSLISTAVTTDTSHQSDPRLQTLQEIANKMAEVNKEYDELLKKEGQTKALADTQKLFASSFKQMQETAKKYGFKLPAFEVPQTIEDVQKWYKAIQKEIKRLGLKNADKVLIELGFKSDKAAIDKQQKGIEKQLKELADRISRTKTAKEFYEKILAQTGDVELAAKLSLSLYGENGKDLNKQIALQINELMQSGEGGIEIGLDVINSDFEINYKNLRKLTEEAYKTKKIGDQAYKDLIAIADNGEKDVAKMIDGWLKATEKAKGYSDKMLDLARTTNEAIAKIEEQRKAGNITDDFAKSQTDGLRKKQAEEESKLMYEAFKDSPMYVQMFDDLDHASTQMMENMRSRLIAMQSEWKNLDPTQLKELQSRLNEIDSQLAKRNPFGELAKGIKKYRELMKNGDGSGNNKGKGSKSYGEAGQYLIDTAKAAEDARKKYNEILHKDGATKEEIADAKQELDEAMSNEEAAQKAVENWKKVKDTIGLAANELFGMMNWASDIAQGIADISEATGADEEDVQYWNDIASALGDISGGIQDIVNAAMSGNVVGIISSTLTAIPKMIIGFGNLFSAGKIKKANKEIKRQQELLEQLEYNYKRLEEASDKFFGNDYISNYNAQIRNLQAQQTAYLRQAEAERSKGKKKDKEKIKEYEEAARDTADEIKKLQDDLIAHFTGSSQSDVAREFAQSWLEAKATFASTTDAIRSKYKDMIRSMIVEGAAAKIIDAILSPMWNKMNTMLQDGDITGAIDYLVNGMDQFVADADNGMNVLWESLKARGYDMQKLLGDTDTNLTGISRDIATASEESINGLAQGINTQNFYISQIHADVARIAASMGATSSTPLPSFDYTPLIQQSLENQGMMIRYQSEIATECRNIAEKCQKQVDLISKVIKPRQTTTSDFFVATKLM